MGKFSNWHIYGAKFCQFWFWHNIASRMSDFGQNFATEMCQFENLHILASESNIILRIQNGRREYDWQRYDRPVPQPTCPRCWKKFGAFVFFSFLFADSRSIHLSSIAGFVWNHFFRCIGPTWGPVTDHHLLIR